MGKVQLENFRKRRSVGVGEKLLVGVRKAQLISEKLLSVRESMASKNILFQQGNSRQGIVFVMTTHKTSVSETLLEGKARFVRNFRDKRNFS